MKKFAWLAPILILGPLALAAACNGGGNDDTDGGGGSGGNDPTGGNSNDGTGGGSGGSGGTTGGTGGTNEGGMGGMGGNACGTPSGVDIGMGGFGGSSTELTELCEARCSHAIACGAAGCDEEDCVTTCAETYPYEYYYLCIEEYTALKACEVENLNGDDFVCVDGTVTTTTAGVAKCAAEDEAFNTCYF